MDMQQYFKNRLAFPLEELAKHRGEWVAWSPDGTRLVAASRDPEDCPIEGIPDADCVIGGLSIP
jgi:hypothetical protein